MYLKENENGKHDLKITMNVSVEEFVRIHEENDKIVDLKVEEEKKVYINAWKMRDAFIIQSFFRRYAKRRNENNSKSILKFGKIINGRLTMVQVYYCSEEKKVKIVLFEKGDKNGQLLMLDNIDFENHDLNEMKNDLINILGKLAYDPLNKQFCIESKKNVKKDLKKEPEISVLLSKTKTPTNIKRLSQLCIIPNEIGLHEIYHGIKKTEKNYYEIKIYINKDYRAIIDSVRQKDSAKESIEVKTDIKNFVLYNRSNEKESELGRMIYKEVILDNSGIIRFDENKFAETILENLYQLRTKKLIKFQQAFAHYLLKSRFKFVITRESKTKVLATSFGLKIGKQYHIIKVITDKDNCMSVVIKSNKAENVLKIKINKFGMPETSELSNIRTDFKKLVTKFVGYDAKKKHLVFRKQS